MTYKISITEAEQQLSQEAAGQRFSTVMQNGTMRVEYYAPVNTDLQTPHKQDELYVIISGSGFFYRHGERLAFSPGDVLFVPAGMEHRFEQFTEDFATWVIFYGPVGGESTTS
ncbi:MAG TPA: cupin domain-containing protein [Chitinophagaceae bacterium]|nr:cupin domain-containing protein [Chitinophagaceae bacterium]